MKLEDRVVRLEDKIDDVKEDVSELKSDFKVHTALMQEHVAGDSKIINEITPLIEALPSLKEIVEEYHYEKIESKKKAEKRKVVMDRIKIVSGILGIIGMISAYFLS